jgi:uncharacterized protein (TIGR02145 family)
VEFIFSLSKESIAEKVIASIIISILGFILVKKFGKELRNLFLSKIGYLIDNDGQAYKTVKIGSQTWMARNFNYNAADSKCYNNDNDMGEKYGRLYTLDTAKTICPKGWRVPTYEDWEDLINFAGGKQTAAQKLKSKNGWRIEGTDNYGFSALPGGCGTRNRDGGKFRDADTFGYWWINKNNDMIAIRLYGDNIEEISKYQYDLASIRYIKE